MKVYGYPKSPDDANTSNTMARVLVTNPSDSSKLLDKSFGSPNEACGGPGEGVGGSSSNCEGLGLGNVLILQTPGESKADPDPLGGDIVFQFEKFASRVTEITLFNIQNETEILLEFIDGSAKTVVVSPMGENAVQTINLNAYDVVEITVRFSGIGAIANVGVCIDKENTPEPVGFNNEPGQPTPAPSGTGLCPEDIELIFQDGATEFPEIPIVIIEQNTQTIKFQVHNTYGETLARIFTQFHEAPTGETECFEDSPFNTTRVTEYTAYCMHHVPITIVDIWVMDDSVLDSGEDKAEVPECCHPGSNYNNPVVQYTFKLRCVTECPEIPVINSEPEINSVSEPKAQRTSAVVNPGAVRRELADKESTLRGSELLDLQGEGLTAESPAFKDAAGAAHANEPSTEGNDGHFCVSEDYPCGENGDMVHVCHYSAKHGYQTFCVRESDSDVLRFYPKDYCGRCVGGYASHGTMA
jgi:hypothetical protein